MRILLSSTPAYGHILPLLPLARAFRDRGDSVALITAEAMAPVVAGEDIEFLPAGPDSLAAVAEVLRTTGHDLWQGVTVEAEAEFFAGARLDLGINEAVAAARAWRPDLIVAEHLDFVGPMTGAICGVPVASLAYGPALQPESVDATAARARRRYEARGLAYEPARWYLDTCPPALQHPGWKAPDSRITLRPEAHRNPGPMPPAPAERGDRRPRVLLSFGTVYASPQLINPLLRELLTQDVDVRVTHNSATPDEFDVDPAVADRFELVAFTPHAELVRDVDVVLTHGGAGTVLGTLAEALPMVVVPLAADQPIQSERVAAAGAGIGFPMGEADPRAVAEAVRRVLAEPGYKSVAAQIAAQIAGYGAPADVAEHLATALAR
ncbi:glycosyltransferase [Catellatospora chokoriensis]|uniref:Glycosyl transferase n=1 Tax=Catellatospora chokoriensis TaxID=310353 RepID=A0A8J3NSZ5_9ACTN|nr:glycosyltransferase [Catellatospora chokoriensis]GIF91540.1 glycosyl transferase [Catellatospora chokoriensis]